MHVLHIAEQCELTELRDSWNTLAGENPFRRFEWLVNWSRTLGKDAELFVLAVKDASNTVVGIAPWQLGASNGGGRVLKFLGAGKACTEYASILAKVDQSQAVAEALSLWLSDHADRWDFVELEATSAEDDASLAFVQRVPQDGMIVHQQPGPACWRIDLPTTWDDYLASLSKSHRKQIRRVDRRLLQTEKAILHTATPMNRREAMRILVDLHTRRWQSVGEAGCFADPDFAAFLTAVSDDMSADHRAAIYWIEFEGKPAAAEFHLLNENVSYAYQSGIDPNLLDLEPGRILHIALLRQAIEAGKSTYDFLRGDEAYKAHWRAEPRQTTNWRIVAPSAGANMRHQVWVASATMKQWIKTGLAFTGIRE